MEAVDKSMTVGTAVGKRVSGSPTYLVGLLVGTLDGEMVGVLLG